MCSPASVGDRLLCSSLCASPEPPNPRPPPPNHGITLRRRPTRGSPRSLMTVYLPLEASSPTPQTPHFLVPSADPQPHVQKVVKAILRARRIAVLCGTLFEMPLVCMRDTTHTYFRCRHFGAGRHSRLSFGNRLVSDAKERELILKLWKGPIRRIRLQCE